MSRRRHPKAAVIPNELIEEILSWLTVKPLIRLRCVSKSWNALISDPSFVQKHLKRSPRNPHLILTWLHKSEEENCCVVPFPIRSSLLENPSTTIYDYPCYRFDDKDRDGLWWRIVGCCNGLVCLIEYFQICFWNPATRTISNTFGNFSDPTFGFYKFAFGYDISTGTYKVVAFRVAGDEGDKASFKIEVKVFSFAGKYNYWRTIQCLPVLPLYWYWCCTNKKNNGVYLSGTLNWLALHNYFYLNYFWENFIGIPVEQYVILSLDLSTETYTQLRLPRGFDEVPVVQPNVGVLMDCICFSHDFKETHFVIWLMKDFGVQESWIQLLKVSYQNLYCCHHYNLQFRFLQLFPLCLSENGDTLILANDETDWQDEAIIYNCRDNRSERTRIRIPNKKLWFWVKDYVESLVSTC